MIKFNDIKRSSYLGKGGIYIIKNNIDDRVYIGSAKDFYNRLISHKNSLKSDYSGCKKLKHFSDKYGLDCLSIELIEFNNKTRDELYEIEKEYIIKYNSVENGLNCSYETKVPQVPFTEERRRNIGAKSKGRYFSPETRKRMSELSIGVHAGENNHNLAKLNNNEVILIKKMLLLNHTVVDIVKLFPHVKEKTIYNIKQNNRWNSIIVNKDDINDSDIVCINKLMNDINIINDNKIKRKGSKFTENNIKHIKYKLNKFGRNTNTYLVLRKIYNLTHQNMSYISLGKIYKDIIPVFVLDEEIKFINFNELIG